MSWKMFAQLVLLMVIGAIVLMAMKCAAYKCPIMGKSMRWGTSYSAPEAVK